MKQFTRICALFLALLLLAGCNAPSDSDKKDKGDNQTAPSAMITEPSATEPAEVTTPEETTAPAEQTQPEVTQPEVTEPEVTQPEVTQPEATEPEVNDPSVSVSPAAAAGFSAVYSEICSQLDTGNQDPIYNYVSTGIKEVIFPKSTKEERYSSITYALEDMNNDGQKEMIVLDAIGNTRILAIFELQEGQPIMTKEGWSRSRLYWLTDGSLYREGSSGAAYAIFEVDGQRWFTYPKGPEQMEMGYYYAADGSYDPDTAQEITAEEYNAKQTEFAQKIAPFSVYYFG